MEITVCDRSDCETEDCSGNCNTQEVWPEKYFAAQFKSFWFDHAANHDYHCNLDDTTVPGAQCGFTAYGPALGLKKGENKMCNTEAYIDLNVDMIDNTNAKLVRTKPICPDQQPYFNIGG